MSSSIVTLETQRLTLRPFTDDDAADLETLASEPEVVITAANIPRMDAGESAAGWIASHAAAAVQRTAINWAIVERATGTLIGAVVLRLAPEHSRGELAYWIGLPFWGRGYATEAAKQVVEYGFQAHALHRIQAHCLPSNIGSLVVLERVGFRGEGLLRDYVYRWGHFEDRQILAIVRQE